MYIFQFFYLYFFFGAYQKKKQSHIATSTVDASIESMLFLPTLDVK